MSATTDPRIVVFGATGKVGRLLVRALHESGRHTLSIGRRAGVLSQLPGDIAVLDIADIDPSTNPVESGDIVVNTAHGRHTAAIVRLCPPDLERLIVIGSARYLTRYRDVNAEEVRQAVETLGKTDLPWVVLHPTMIYGAEGENNVQRLAALIRRFHVIPLPGGGRSLIQPIHVDDLVDALVKAIDADGLMGKAVHLAGPTPISYAGFVRAIADAIGSRVWVVSLPYSLMVLLAWVTNILPGTPTITQAEVLRLLEDKDIENHEMEQWLGITPRPLSEGLKDVFSVTRS